MVQKYPFKGPSLESLPEQLHVWCLRGSGLGCVMVIFLVNGGWWNKPGLAAVRKELEVGIHSFPLISWLGLWGARASTGCMCSNNCFWYSVCCLKWVFPQLEKQMVDTRHTYKIVFQEWMHPFKQSLGSLGPHKPWLQHLSSRSHGPPTHGMSVSGQVGTRGSRPLLSTLNLWVLSFFLFFF